MAGSKRTTREVKIDEHGRRIGAPAPRARLSDKEIERLRALAAAGLTPRQIAVRFVAD